MDFDYRQPRRFTALTALGMLFWGTLALVTLPLWIVPVWMALSNNPD